MNWNHDFSSLIAKIYHHTVELPLSDFRHFVFEEVQQHIGFDSGIWATRSKMREQRISIDTFLFNQPFEMISNYERLIIEGVKDELFEKALASRDEVLLADALTQGEIYQRHCQLFGLEHGLCVITQENLNGAASILSLYRSDREQPFTEFERQCFEFLVPHIVESFRLNLLNHFRTRVTGSGFSAVCDSRGTIIEAEDGFLLALGAGRNSGGQKRFDIGLSHLTEDTMLTIREGLNLFVSYSQGLFHLQLLRERRRYALTERQRLIVSELIKGLPDKTIADHLHISPKTVRNQLSTIYNKLNVNSRAAAIAAVLSAREGANKEDVRR